jgi:hypothetical protein
MDHTGQGDDRRGAVRAALDPGDRGTVQAMSSRSAEAVVSEVLRFETLPLAEGGARRAVVRWSDGTESIPLSWYEDEILITEGDHGNYRVMSSRREVCGEAGSVGARRAT